MAFDKIREKTDSIQEQFKDYIEKSASYYKLWFFKVVMKSTTMLIKFALILLCVSMVLLFVSLAAAIAIGECLGNYAVGFLIVAAFYLVLTIGVFLVKNKVVEGPILEKFSEIFFND